MKLKVNTKQLQALVTKAMKCASCKPGIPITGMMAIELKDNVLTLTTTDDNNYLWVKDECKGDNFYVVVNVELFVKLISKLTSETVTMSVVNDALEIDGNGHYVIELPYDGEGELVKYPDPRKKMGENVAKTEVSLSTLKMILATAKASVDVTKDYYGCYAGYYIGDDCAITTDSFKMCLIDTKILDTPALLWASTMELVPLLSGETVTVYKDDKFILMETPDGEIFAQLMDCIEDYNVEVIKKYTSTEMAHSCVVQKDELLQVLDRIALFVTKLDEVGIYLTFGKEELKITSRQTDGAEAIAYQEYVDGEEFSCCVNVERLSDLVKSVLSDTVEIFYGNEDIIKIEDGNITKALALIED